MTLEPIPTGRVQWDRGRYGLEWLEAEYEYVFGPTEYERTESWQCTEWCVYRQWLWFVSTRVGHPGDNLRMKFWSRKKAKAYAEVCYRMGVHG